MVGGVSYLNAFHGGEVIDVILSHGVAKSRPAAHALCRLLLKQQFFVPVSTEPGVGSDFVDSETMFYSFSSSATMRPRSVSAAPVASLSKSQQKELKLKERETQKNLERELKQKKMQEKEQKHLEKERQKSLAKEQKQKDKAKKKGAGGSKPLYSSDPADYQHLLQMIVNPDSILVRALCSEVPASESEFLSNVLLAIFQSFHSTDLLIQVVIATELDKTLHPGTLFRGNSLSSKVLTAYSRMVGTSYLKATLSGILESLSVSSESYEIDPSKISDTDDLSVNLGRVSSLFQRLFDSIMTSTLAVPSEIKLICSSLGTSCNEKFPDSAQFAVGGFFFLRFLGPIMVTPDIFGLTSHPCSPQARRAVLLVSKILQSLSNGVEFGAKEDFMMPLNHLIIENRDSLAAFIEKISNNEGAGVDFLSAPAPSFFAEPTELDYADVGKLASVICRYFPKIVSSFTALQALSPVARIGKTTSLEDELKQALEEIQPECLSASSDEKT